MPFIRQTRDKRGFDHTYVMHVGRGANGAQQTRVLYVFRSPANLRVGYSALDAEVREALEHTHPDLNFDWNALTRDAVTTRVEPQAARHAKVQRQARPPAPPSRAVPAPSPSPASVVPVDDQSLLGQLLGPSEAARLRGRHADLVQRIGRRARTPDERERLLEQSRRLNPDSWADEGVIRAQAPTMDRACDALAAELPSRRRGRRGGRRRPAEGVPPPSGIMATGATGATGEGSEQTHEQFEAARVDDPDRAADSGSDAGLGAADPKAGLPDGD